MFVETGNAETNNPKVIDLTIEEPEKVNVENLLNNAIFQQRKTMLDDTKTHFFNQQSENIQWDKYVTFDDDSFFNSYPSVAFAIRSRAFLNASNTFCTVL